MIDFNCPNCEQHYDYAAQIPQRGGHVVNDGFKLIFFCSCGERITEREIWRTGNYPQDGRLNRALGELEKQLPYTK